MSGNANFTGTHEEWEELRVRNKISWIAKVCHQANKAWCESEGDVSQKDWEKSED